MGLFKKLNPKNLMKKSVGAKLVKKAISKDPIGSKILGKSKGAQMLGLVDKKSRAAPAAKSMTTGGNQPASRVSPALKMHQIARQGIRKGRVTP